MRIYNMRCTHDLCGRAFDWHTKWGLYEASKRDNFKDVRCWHCGRLGATRAWNHAVPDLTVKGTWGKNASPELRGKDYYGKGEYQSQVALSGSKVVDSGQDRGVRTPVDQTRESVRDAAREKITSLLIERGEMRLKDIVKESGLKDHIVHDVIYKAPGRIHKVGRGTYGLTGVSSQTSAS